MRFLALLVALLLTGPAAADNYTQRVCQTFLGLAATDDNTPLFVGMPGGSKLIRIGCFVNADVAIPASIAVENGAGTAADTNLLCAENGANVTWAIPSTDFYFGENDEIRFDVVLGTTGDYTICGDFSVSQ